MKSNKYVSINFKLVRFLVILLIGILGVGLLINKLFFYDYYLKNEKDVIYDFAEELDTHYDKDSEVENKIEEFVFKKRASIMIFSVEELSNPEIVYQSDLESGPRGKMMIMQRGIGISKEVLQKTQENGFYFFNITHSRFSAQLLALSYELNNGDILLITLPFEEFTNAANLAIKFNAFIALISLVVGGISVYLLSIKITKPIIKLSSITEKISNLDFSEKYESPTNDEISMLGENINEMSVALEQSLHNLKNANAQLLKDIKEKDKLVEMRKEFIGNISHELKTPIALIMGYSEGLRENITLDQKKKDYYLEVISKESKHMDTLVKDLLNLTELEYDAFNLNKVTTDLSSLMDEVLDRYSLIISNKKINILIEKEDIIMIEADKKRLEQAFANLVINALEHTGENGLVKISVICGTSNVKVIIENTGENIPEEYLDKIWTNFYKIKEKAERKIGGSGIGLSIVRAIIEKHDGEYGAYNSDGSVVFWFNIPR